MIGQLTDGWASRVVGSVGSAGSLSLGVITCKRQVQFNDVPGLTELLISGMYLMSPMRSTLNKFDPNCMREGQWLLEAYVCVDCETLDASLSETSILMSLSVRILENTGWSIGFDRSISRRKENSRARQILPERKLIFFSFNLSQASNGQEEH